MSPATLPFNQHIVEYEDWYQQYNHVFLSEVFALRKMLPSNENLDGLEVGVATGRLALALGIGQGLEPSAAMRELAIRRGIDVLPGIAERMPYGDEHFDYILMSFCISYFNDLHAAFAESFRVLKKGGCLVVGFVEKDSLIGREYEAKRGMSVFYANARFYTVNEITAELKKVGFQKMEFVQTLFGKLDDITELQIPQTGYGAGSYIVVKAVKP